jgi:HK97 gp10 family phage protein
MKVTVKTQGLRGLEQALRALPKATGKAVLRRTGIKALAPFDKAWREKAPHLTGQLEESGGVGTKLTRRQARLNRKREDKSSVEVFAGPNDPAAVPQEFGTATQSAQPFARRAWDETKDETLEIVKDELGKQIDKAAARLARKAARELAKAKG